MTLPTRPDFELKSLTIICVDRWRSGAFYEEVLGAVELPGDLGCKWYRLGSFTITLSPGALGRLPDDPEHPMTMLWLEVDDLEAARRHFDHHQVEILQPSDEQMMTIADPDGLPIEIWERIDEE